jgi:hypothetical protein
MIAHRKSKKFDPEEDETAYFETQVKMCRRCKQEYTGACPISSASCPMEADESDAIDDEDEKEDSDFDDVGNLNEVLAKDDEADKAAEEDDEIPDADLEDDD